jgi:hypothetical protein
MRFIHHSCRLGAVVTCAVQSVRKRKEGDVCAQPTTFSLLFVCHHSVRACSCSQARQRQHVRSYTLLCVRLCLPLFTHHVSDAQHRPNVLAWSGVRQTLFLCNDHMRARRHGTHDSHVHMPTLACTLASPQVCLTCRAPGFSFRPSSPFFVTLFLQTPVCWDFGWQNRCCA